MENKCDEFQSPMHKGKNRNNFNDEDYYANNEKSFSHTGKLVPIRS